MFYTQADQVRAFAGLNKADMEQYVTMQQLTDTPIIIGNSKGMDFTLPVDGNVLVVAEMAETTDVLYIDGTSSKSLNGGIISNLITVDGTASYVDNIFGAKVGNIVPILDASNDDVLADDGKKVYAYLATTGADGAVANVTRFTLSFVVSDDAGSYTPYTLKAGTYKAVVNRAYTFGTATINGVLGNYLTDAITTAEQSYEEIFNLITNLRKQSVTLAVTAINTLPVDKLIVVEIDSATNGVTFKDSTGANLVGTISSTLLPMFPTKVVAGTLGSAYVAGVTAEVGASSVVHSALNITAVNTVTLDATNSMAGNKLYAGTAITLEW